MYYISIYFDEKTSRRIQHYIDQTAEKTGNTFMTDGRVPPHITVSAFEANKEDAVRKALEHVASRLETGPVQWVSFGVFLPYVIYLAPVLNEYLHKLSVEVYEAVSGIEGVSVSPYYRPLQWFPHATIGKKLTKEQLNTAFGVLQNQFGTFSGSVTHIGLARTNPYRELAMYEL